MNSCYLCHLHSCVLSLTCFCQIHLHLCICFICFGGPISWILKHRRFASKVGHFRYLMGVSHCFGSFHGRTQPVQPVTKTKRPAVLGEGRWRRCSGALFFFHTVILGTNATFVVKTFFLFFRFFSIEFSTEKVSIEVFKFFCLFYSVKCW